MKSYLKISLILIVALIFCQQAQAQFGIKAGYNLSSLKYFTSEDNNDFNEEFISGYQFGVVYQVGLGDKLSFQPEAAFYTTGGKSNFFNADVQRSYQFAKLNGLVNYNLIGNNDGLAVQLTGGVFAGYALSAHLDVDGQGEDKIDFKDQDTYERTNVGYIIGVGIKLNSFIVSLRSSIGVSELVNFNTTDVNGATLDNSIKSRDFSLVGIYLF